MALASGTRLGSYVVDTLLGTGGMGEVYRAHDTRLKRDVALKILAASSAGDPERLARFQREAHVLASLDHPNIGAIYGIEDSDGITALVLQLVEGDTLADRIARGPIPLDEALPIARQIAEALEAAHEQGVIHRDLKPANVKVTPDGQVKVLDFGLAKFGETGKENDASRSTGPAAATMSPTITTPALMTGVGVILGTAAYMSPEQAKGRAADKRSDVWAYGCVLYEMLTGRRAFDGDDVAETLAAVIRAEPDWNALPADLPAALVSALKRCVVKDRRERIGDIAAVLFALRESGGGSSKGPSPAPVPARSRVRTAASYLISAAAVCAVTSAVWWTLRPSAEPRPVVRFALTLPENARLGATIQRVVAISRDGSKVAYQTGEGVFVRSLANSDAKLIRIDGSNLAFSPDGEWLAFYIGSDRTLRKISVSGGTPVKLADIGDIPAGLSWEGDQLLFGQTNGIQRVSAGGGTPEVIARVAPGELAAAPHMLPDGDSLLFTLAPQQKGLQGAGSWDQSRVVVQSLKSGRRTTVIESGSDAHYISTGHLVYVVGGVLFACPFNLQHMQASGSGVPVVDGIRRGGGGGTIQSSRLFNSAQVGISESGTLVYVPGPSAPSSLRMQLVVSEADGKVTPLKIEPAPFRSPRSSPDGTRIVYGTDDGKDASVWVYDLSGSATPRRLTFESHNRYPMWSSDGQWVIFQSDREGDLAVFRVRADGSTGKVERLTRPEAGTTHVPEASSPDGKVLLFSSTKGSEVTLEALSLIDGTVKPLPGLKTDRLFNATFSPDGRHLAYSTRRPDEARNTLYVEPYPPTGQKHFIASGDAHMPVWSHDGRDLFFMDPLRANNGRVGFSRVRIDMRQGFALSEPTRVERPFYITAPGVDRPRTFDILPDGRFVGVRDESEAGEPVVPHVEVVLNWFEELKQRVPVK